MIRLELDDCLAKKLANQPFDMVKFIVASKELEIMFGGVPDAPATFDVDGAIAGLERSIQGILDARAHKTAETDTNPGGGDAPSDQEGPRPPSAAPGAAAVGCGPAPVEPAPAAEPAPRPMTDIEKMEAANAKSVPQHYLKGPPEPWRPYSHLYL